jgi:Flp pilus assembly protein TadD
MPRNDCPKILLPTPQKIAILAPMRSVSISAWLVVGSIVPMLPIATSAQSTAPRAPAQPNFDPADVYYQAWLFVREAETLQKQGRYAEALQRFQRAATFFDSIHRFHPEWKKDMVDDRLSLTKSQITKVQPLAAAEQKKQDIAVAEMVESGGDTRPVAPMDPLAAGNDPTIDVEVARTKALEAEVARLNRALASPSNSAARDQARVNDMQRQRDDAQARLQQAMADLQQLRNKLATAPIQSDLDRLNARLSSLEQEKQAMGMALAQSREQQLQSQAKIQTLQADFAAARQQAADLQRNLEIERAKSNEITSAQMQQLQQLEQTLKQKDQQIAQFHQQVTTLQTQLQESREAFQELRTERDDLLRQRDHMAALLKLNETGRIQQLIEQNMGLAKELREAKERVERLHKNQEQTNDQLTEALRDLAIAKTKIIGLQKEKQEQQQRLTELEMQLQNNEKSLAKGEASASKEEADTLREIIKRQLRVQERRKHAAHLLLQAAKKQMTAGDSDYDEALAMLTDQEVTLSEEEQKLLDARQVDGEIYSPYAGSKARVDAATTEMHQQIENYTKAAVRAFGSQRLQASREVLEMILDLHPGHIATMTKLGIVQLRLNDPAAAAQILQVAVENDESRSLSHRLLGLAHYRNGQLPEAEQSLRRALEIDPQDPASYTIYGNTMVRLQRADEAEQAYLKAIKINPQATEALHNLALICQNSGRSKEAKRYYEEALQFGAQPNPELESAIEKSL